MEEEGGRRMVNFNYSQFLKENNLGPYAKILSSFQSKPNLCPEIFHKDGEDYVMNDDVREKLLEIAKAFIDWMGLEVDVEDITLTGSLANFNWSEYSDIDLHILINFSRFQEDEDLVKGFFDAKKNVWNNEHDIKIKGFDTEVYVQDIKEKHTSTGVYSVQNNRWIIEPEYQSTNIDKQMVLRKSKQIATKIDQLLKAAQDGIDVVKDIDQLKDKIKVFRQAGLDRAGEYSYENLTFKLLRRTGYIEKLFGLKNDIIDQQLSL